LDVDTSSASRQRAILIAMGEAGLITRVLAGRFGAAWTYAGNLSSVNQVSTDTLLNEYRFRSIGPETEVYGLVGSPIAHSVSPAMHTHGFAATQRHPVYLPFPAAARGDFAAFS